MFVFPLNYVSCDVNHIILIIIILFILNRVSLIVGVCGGPKSP